MQLQLDVFLLNNVIVTVYKRQIRHVKNTAIMLKFKCVIMQVVVNFDNNGKCPCSDKASLYPSLHIDIFSIKSIVFIS